MSPFHRGTGSNTWKKKYEPDTEITIQLMHNFYLDDERPEDYVPAAEAPAPIHAILYEEGTRETYVLNGDGRHERLFGIVYREAAETGAAVPRNLVPDLRLP